MNSPGVEKSPALSINQCANAPCATLAHLQWTLAYPWNQITGGRPLEADWVSRSTRWRQGRNTTHAWMDTLEHVPVTPTWRTLQDAHAAAGLDPNFRTADAYCRHRRYGLRPGLADRFARKLDHDGSDDASPLARAIRGYLDIVHVHPFNDGNARAACTWLGWSLVAAGCDVPDLGPLVRLPLVPGDNRIPELMRKGLS